MGEQKMHLMPYLIPNYETPPLNVTTISHKTKHNNHQHVQREKKFIGHFEMDT